MRFLLRIFLINVILSLFFSTRSEAIANHVIACGDEWALSNSAFAINAEASTVYTTNIRNYLGGSRYLIFQNGTADAFGTVFQKVLAGLGVEVTVNPAQPFSTSLIESYDAIFVGGSLASGTTNSVVLNDYVQNGGSVYLCLGTGVWGNAPSEAAAWNPFLNSWGLHASNSWFPPPGFISVPLAPSSHPLRTGLDSIVWSYGQEVTSLSSPQTATTILMGEFGGSFGSRGVIGIATTISPPSFINTHPYHSSYSGSGTPPWNRLDTSKTLVKEGNEPQLLTFDNLINTAKGINGIVFDIENLPDAGNLSTEDFEFQVSPQGAYDAGANPPANWQAAPDPSSITVTPGSPDRVLIQWSDGSIMNRWLRITVLATEETGLTQPETYYIGHLLGETTGPSDGTFTVSFADITSIRSEVGQTVDASSITDIDKNGTVSFADISAMRSNVGAQLTQILIP